MNSGHLLTKNNLVKVLFATALCIIALTFVNSKQVHAAVPPPASAQLPDRWRTYLTDCDTRGYSPSLVQWVSPVGAPTQERVTVAAGTANISMQLNFAGQVCYDNSKVSSYSFNVASIVSDNGATVTRPGGGSLSFSPHNVVGTYSQGASGFGLSKTGGLTPGIYKITVEFQGINVRTESPTYDCTREGGSPINPGSGSNYGACPIVRTTFDLEVIVTGTPDLLFTAACTPAPPFARVTANTKTGSNYDVRLIVDGVDQSGPFLQQNRTNGSTTTFDISGWVISESHTFQVRVLDRGNGERTTSAVISVGPCAAAPPPGCPSLPNPIVSVTLDRSYSESGPARAGFGSHTQRVTQETRYTSHEDISPGGDRVLPPLVSQTAGNPGNVQLDYSVYIEAYPFDNNQARVNYNERYYQYNYTYSGPAVYDPVYRYEQHWHPDPDGTGPQIGFWHTHQVFDHWQFVGYSPVLNSFQDLNVSRSKDAHLMTPCWDRAYDVNRIDITKPQLDPDRESPTSSVMTGAINAQFDVSAAGRGKGREIMRQASRVNGIPYQVSWQIRRFNGAAGASGVSSSGSTTINASSAHQHATGSFSVSGSAGVTVEMIPGDLRVGDMVCWTVSVPSRKMGNLRLDGTAVSPSGSISASDCSVPVVNRPYFKVFNNDIVAGGQFGGACGIAGGPGIRSYFRSLGIGSSTQYAAFALGNISGVSSASLRNGSVGAPQPPTGLSFANSSGHGGNYTAADGLTCLPDYFASMPSSATNISNAPGSIRGEMIDPNTNPLKIEYFKVADGNLNLNVPNMNVPEGVRKVFYINGTLTISRDIILDDAWTDRDQVPYLMFIADDIVIGSGVTRLDGVYVAQGGSGGTGAFRTCDSTSFSACQQPLVVNGAVIATRLELLRTRGSLRNARLNEGRPGTAGTDCSVPFNTGASPGTAVGTPGGASCAAEIFNFMPDIFLTLTQLLTPEENFKLDSYVTLPPNL